MSPLQSAAVLAWGTLVGLDLASVGQVMITRPLVAGTVTGWILGDAQAGFLIGVAMELLALELLPFGASRYPDYGLGAVAGAGAAVGAPGLFGLGVGVFVGVYIAALGELGIRVVRSRTTRDVRRCEEAIEGGDARAVRRLHRRGLVRDAVRGLSVTAAGIGLGVATRWIPPPTTRGVVLLAAAAGGIAVGTAAASGVRIAQGTRRGYLWFAAGSLGGVAWVLWR